MSAAARRSPLDRLLPAGLGPGGRRALLGIGALAVVRAVALVLMAEAIGGGVVAIQSGADLRGWLLMGAVGAALRSLAVWATAVVAARGAADARRDARRRLAAHLLAPGRSGAGAGESAQLASNGLDALDEYFGTVIPAVVSAFVVPVGLGAWILARDWVSALIVVVTLPLIPFFMVLIGKYTQERVDDAQAAIARLADRMLELARGLPVLVGLGRDAEQARSLAAVQDETRRRTLGTLRVAFLSSLALELIATISVAVVAVFLGVRLLDGSVLLAPALVALVLAPEVYGAFREVGSAFHASQDGLSALTRLDELERGAGGGAVVDASATLTDRGLQVSVGGVRHECRTAELLAGVRFGFDRGRTTAIVGSSGSGKSTLLAVIAGSLAGRVPLAYAPQAPAFLADTVEGELAAYGAGGADAAAVLERFGLASHRAAPPALLSPGEARRLAVAAAVVAARAGAEVVLLDEPTAHLDRESAAVVREEILAVAGLAHRPVVLVVTHDGALVAACDVTAAVPERGVRQDAGEAAGRGVVDEPPVAVDAQPTPAGGEVDSAAVPGAGLEGRRWALAVLLGVLAAGFALALSAVSGWLIVRASEGPAIMYLLVAIVGVRFFGIGRAIARYGERLITHDAAFVAVDRLRLRLWAALASRGAAARHLLAGGSTAELLVARLGQLREELPRTIVPIVSGVLVLVATGVAGILIAPGPGALAAVALLAAVAVGGLLALPLRGALRRRGALRASLGRRIAGAADAGPVLAANGAAPRVTAAIDAVGAELAAQDRRLAVVGGFGQAATTFLVLLGVIGALGAGAAAVDTAPAVAAVALLALAALDPVLSTVGALRRLPSLFAAWRVIRPALEPVPAVTGGERSPAGGGLDVVDLAARWPQAPEPVFESVSASVRPGRWLVVTGPSGSGKSTLLTVLLGRLAPDRGDVAVGGVPIREAEPAAWRRSVGWCPQEAHVFDSTIRGNLLVARGRDERPGDEEMAAVLREVGLGPLLDELADGLATRVGPAGSSLSGGERQRLAVARSLLGGAPVLLLDEPTAHLDEPGARALLADLRRATSERTVVLVTHRLDELGRGDGLVDLGEHAPAGASR